MRLLQTFLQPTNNTTKASTMADDIDEQVTAHIREILHLVHSVKGKTLHKLNELVGQTSKFNIKPSRMYSLSS